MTSKIRQPSGAAQAADPIGQPKADRAASGPDVPFRLHRAVLATFGAAAVAMAAADVVNPQYNPVTDMVSRYVNGNAGWLITSAFVALGAASAVVTGLLWRAAGLTRRGRIGRGALTVWSAGVLVAAIFPADPPGQYGQPSTSELGHGLAAFAALAALPLAAALLTPMLTPSRRPGHRLMALTAAISVVATIALTVAIGDVMGGPSLGIAGAPTVVGLVERITIAADLAWLAFATVLLVGTRRAGDVR